MDGMLLLNLLTHPYTKSIKQTTKIRYTYLMRPIICQFTKELELKLVLLQKVIGVNFQLMFVEDLPE